MHSGQSPMSPDASIPFLQSLKGGTFVTVPHARLSGSGQAMLVLRRLFSEITQWAYDKSGIELPENERAFLSRMAFPPGIC